MAPPLVCPNSRIWLRATFQACNVSPIRLASTTTAIKRGLRAEQNASRPRAPRRDWPPSHDRNDRRQGRKRSIQTPAQPRSGGHLDRRFHASATRFTEGPPQRRNGKRRDSKVERGSLTETPGRQDLVSKRRSLLDNGNAFIRDDEIRPQRLSSRPGGGRRDGEDEGHKRASRQEQSLTRKSRRPPNNISRESRPLIGNFEGLRRRIRGLQAAEQRTEDLDVKVILAFARALNRACKVILERGMEQVCKTFPLDMGSEIFKQKRNRFLGTPGDEGWLWSRTSHKPENVPRSMLWLQLDQDQFSIELLTGPTTRRIVSEAGWDSVATGGPTSNSIAPRSSRNEGLEHAADQKPSRSPTPDFRTDAEHLAQRQDRYAIAPATIRTKAASTFIYGANAVWAALVARRRQLYRLYLQDKVPQKADDLRDINNAAGSARVPMVRNTHRQTLDAMSDNRPHNGVVLEASQLPAPPVMSLGTPNPQTGEIPLHLCHQSAEDADVNGTPAVLPYLNKEWRKPLVLMLDGVLDPQNVGNVIRTAYYYGVNAIAVSTNTCCSLASSTLAKAASGACEAIQIFMLPKPSNFVYESKKAGWKIYAAVPYSAAPSFNTGHPAKRLSHTAVSKSSALAENPIILILGAEGEGLRENLKQRADVFVSIPPRPRQPTTQGPSRNVHVDSINVGTAAALLIDCLVRQPATDHTKRTHEPVVSSKSSEPDIATSVEQTVETPLAPEEPSLADASSESSATEDIVPKQSFWEDTAPENFSKTVQQRNLLQNIFN